MSGESFYIDGQGAVSTPATEAPPVQLGGQRTSCAVCDREWRWLQPACVCGSHELVTRYLPAPLLERVGGAIRTVLTPAKAKAPPATVAQREAVRTFASAVERFQSDLAATDATLRAAVRDGVQELEIAHGALHRATSMTGDAAPVHLDHLGLALTYLEAALNRTLASLEEDDSR